MHLEALPVLAQRALGDLLAHVTYLDGRIGEYDTQLKLAARDDEQARRLMNLRGVGPVGASAIVATVGSAHEFRNGRQFAAWLGMRHPSGCQPSLHEASAPQQLCPVALRCARVQARRPLPRSPAMSRQ